MAIDERNRSVAAYIAARMRAAGVSAEEAAANREEDAAWLLPVLNGDQPLPLEKIAEVSGLIGADPMELFSRCIAEYLPETYAAIEPRLEPAFTTDELALVKHLRNSVGSPHIAGLTDAQQRKFSEWLQSLREAPISKGAVH